MARGTIMDYFARVPRQSQNQGATASSSTSSSNANGNASSPVPSSSPSSAQPQNPPSTQDESQAGPRKKKPKITANNGRKGGSSSQGLEGGKTEENVGDEVQKEVSFIRSAHSRSKLRMFPSFPVDIILEIFSHLQPHDLIHLMRTTKDLRRLILHRSATFVWKSAFANVDARPTHEDDEDGEYDEDGKDIDLPPCPQDLALPQWASLIWDTFCQNCLTSNVRSANFALRARLCSKCAKIKLLREADLKPKDSQDDALIGKCVAFSVWTDQRCCTIADRDAFLKELQNIRSDGQIGTSEGQQEVSQAQTSKLEAFIKEREKERSARYEHAGRCNVWMNNILEKRENELDRARRKRASEIRSRLKKKGYETEIRFLDKIDVRGRALLDVPKIYTFGRHGNEQDKHPQLKVRKELTEKGWARLEPSLEAWMLQARVLVVKDERAKRIQVREKLFHDAYLNWRNDPKNLEKYPSWMLMPRFADILGVELGGVGEEDESGWHANDPLSNDRWYAPELLGKGLRTVREMVEFGYDRTTMWEEKETEKHGATWLIFNTEQATRERMQKSIDLLSKAIEEEKTGVIEDTHPQITPETATEVINKQVPKFVDLWRREKIKSLWERAYTKRDLSQPEYEHWRTQYTSSKPDPRIRFPWWDDEAATKRPFEESNSYNGHSADEKEKLRLKDLQLAVVVFRCEEGNSWRGHCHRQYDKQRCIDDGMWDPNAPGINPWEWVDARDNIEPCLWYPQFFFHPCTSMKPNFRGDPDSGPHASLSIHRQYEKMRSAAWEGIEEEEAEDAEKYKKIRGQCAGKFDIPANDNPRKLKFDEKASKTVRNLLEAACLDEQEVKAAQMDELKLRFVCLKCSHGRKCDGERRVRVWAWREAVQHSLKSHFGDAQVAWECISPSETAKALLLEETQKLKLRYHLENKQKMWKCLQCRDLSTDTGRMTLSEMYEHWRLFRHHGDPYSIRSSARRSNRPDRPQAPEHILGYYEALDYAPRELPAVKMTVLPLSEEDLKARETIKEERRKRKEMAAWEKERAKFPEFWDIVEMGRRRREAEEGGDGNKDIEMDLGLGFHLG